MTDEAQPLLPWEHVRARLSQAEPNFYELEPGQALGLEMANEDWMLELTPDGRLICQTGMAMEDIESLLSSGTPEDLGTDELAKQAKYYLQHTVSKYRKTLIQAGFQEKTEMNDSYVAVTFERTVDFRNLEEVTQTVRWCQQQFQKEGQSKR